MDDADSLERQRAILDYWTLVEFFSPFRLDVVQDAADLSLRVFAESPTKLPWLDEKPLAENDPTSPFTKAYILNLALFSTEETADRARHVLLGSPSEWKSVDWERCAAAGSLSCFARLAVSPYGTPLWGTLSLSTSPWAHGHLLDGKRSFLTMELYWKEVHQLLHLLKEEFTESLPRVLVKKPKEYAPFFDYAALGKLTQHLFQWAGFAPKYYPIALIKAFTGEQSYNPALPQLESPEDVPILNSFYISDLERVQASLNRQAAAAPIRSYLSRDNSSRVVLDEAEGKAAILAALKPTNLPKGRWPSKDSNHLALMQQFAVNQTFSSLEQDGLFSVNGPPGTGKTTLLREVVAGNMVARGAALAQFEHARDAFIGKRAIGFNDGHTIFVGELHPSLLGYEMLLVSSNNIAVQNISLELPLRSQLDDTYSNASYLELAACRLMKNSWGLISVPLGRRENCRHFVEELFMKREGEGPADGRIWEFAEKYRGPSFAEARELFLAAQDAHDSLSGEIYELAKLHDQVVSGELQAELETCRSALLEVHSEIAQQEKLLAQLLADKADGQKMQALLQQKEELLARAKPGILDRIFKGKNWQMWSQQSLQHVQKQISSMEEGQVHTETIRYTESSLAALQALAQDKENQLRDLQQQMTELHELYADKKSAFPEMLLPIGVDDLDDADIQKFSLYQDTALNRRRSELFLAAMALHEAWLSETMRPRGGFRGNLLVVSQLLQGKSPTTADDTLLAWQSVFLLVPLISSTFASVERLFRYLQPQSLGWLFIDEAGQAVPQAAVGAIWRAKKVLSMGDPFQIEPISTVPPEIVDGLAKHFLKDHQLAFAPSRTSVQHLMDAAAKYVSRRSVGEFTSWLGAPLRVHRRCIEPMFSIANEIAYEQSMILATPACADTLLPPSCWYDVKGNVSQRQYVPAQGEELLKRLSVLLALMPAPDLFILSPFREVVLQIQQLLMRSRGLQKAFDDAYPSLSWYAWVRASVGTIHSFQGKQAAVVFFLVGADANTLGALEWVTNKPNLLNVALTRASKRFFVIGDYHLWRQWPYFDVATKKLRLA